MLSKSILVVEDDADIRELLLEYLESDGYEPTGAEDGRVALDKLEEPGYHPALILLDRNMDRMDGTEFLDALFAHPVLCPRRMPVVMMSAAGEVKESRVVAHLRKPFNFSELLAVVAKYAPNNA